ncbi:farnesol dehydrogenase-like [Venturia canescens]|uniref:farnesol dehydrogenase-like n=1 Tax=Venturia canescens TaxID=32260 RepID=UPI001C9D12E1|nr:farnesol dehydrogenase-like [Venturia canescens]
MDRWLGKVAIVTGASAGIGAEITEALVKSGVKVVGVARRVEKIRDLATQLKGQKGSLYPMRCDMGKEEDILKVFQWTEKEFGGVDILINNAGVSIPENILDGSTKNYRKIMDINVIAVAICAREAVKSMKKRNILGHIINLVSTAGHNAEMINFPVSIYCASKYAVIGMSHSLRNELATAKLRIKVTCISPGAVETDMIAGAAIPKEVLDRDPMLAVKDITNAVIYALSTPPNVQVKELIITPLIPRS